MFYEYALEPAVLSSWDRTRFFLDAFGPSKGRFLAEYPRSWKRMVYEGLRCQDVEKKRIVERLSRLDKRVFSPRASTPYDPALAWIDNAEREHQRVAFHAIIAVAASLSAHVLDAAEVDDADERWRVHSGRFLTRDAAALAEALRLLLVASKRIVVIDPYFRADQDDKTRPLAAFCSLVAQHAAVEVHFSDEPRGHDPCMRDAARALPRVLPEGRKVTLHCWKEQHRGERLHNRYLLTEIGGVQFGDGIELGSGADHDRVSILDEPSHAKIWADYLGSPPAFDQVGAPQEFVGGPNRRTR